jgi:hypothetical protein
MPFESKAQARWMFAKHPKMAKEWAAHTPNMKTLPDYANPHHSHPFSIDPSSKGCLICGQGRSAHRIK